MFHSQIRRKEDAKAAFRKRSWTTDSDAGTWVARSQVGTINFVKCLHIYFVWLFLGILVYLWLYLFLTVLPKMYFG